MKAHLYILKAFMLGHEPCLLYCVSRFSSAPFCIVSSFSKLHLHVKTVKRVLNETAFLNLNITVILQRVKSEAEGFL